MKFLKENTPSHPDIVYGTEWEGWHKFLGKDRVNPFEQAHSIFRRAKDRGRLPRHTGKDAQEKKDAVWIRNKIEAKNGRARGFWDSKLKNVAAEYGFPNAFNNSNKKQETVARAHEILQRAKERGRLPRHIKRDVQEKKDAQWISGKCGAKRGKKKGVWFSELDDIAKEYGFPDAFKLIDKKRIAINKAHEIFQRAKSRGSLPKMHNQNDEQEKGDASWLSTKRRARKGSDSIWYPELEKIAKQYGFPSAFVDRWEKHTNNIHEIFQRAKKRQKLPNQKSNDPLERRDAQCIHNYRQAKKKHNRGAWNQELDMMAESYGFPGAFDTKNRKQESIDMAHDVFRRANERGSLPNKRSDDDQEKKDGSWIQVKRKAKRGAKGYTWYPKLDQIAKKHGYEGVFDSKKRQR